MIKKLFTAAAALVIALPMSAATFQEVNGFIKAKKWSEAETSCRKLISNVKTEKDRFNAYMKLMMIMRRLNKNAELVKDADAFLANCKDDNQAAELLIYKGIGQRAVKQAAESLETFKLAVDKAKDGRAAREAACYFIDTAPGLKKHAEAQEMYVRAAKFQGSDKDARLHLAASFAYWDNNKMQEASAILDKAEKIENMSTIYKEMYLRYRGTLLHRSGKYEEAVKHFDQALTLKLTDYCVGRLNFFKAQSLEKLNKNQEAIAAYKAALEYKGSAYFKGAAQRAVKKLEK